MKTISIGLKMVLLAVAAAFVIALTPAAAQDAEAATIPAYGIDVSSYQGDINWSQVAGSGVTFAMVRVGNTRYGLDSRYYENIVEANAAGIRVGVYCYSYATTVEEAAADAQLVINAISGLPVSFPVVLDFETDAQMALSLQEQNAIINTFCSMIYAAGYTPMVYSYLSWFQDTPGLAAWDQWAASWYTSEIGYACAMWQFSDSGTVSGISGYVDQDYCLKDYFSLIPSSGLVETGGLTYYYVNYRRQFGLQYIGDQLYWFDSTTGAMLKDQTLTDEAGNITRICKDGHVVVITAEMQNAAAQALLNAQTQAALLAQYETEQAAYEAAAADALNQYAAAQALADEYVTTLELAQYNAAVLPTEENLATLAAAQTQYELYAANAATLLETYQTFQASAENAAALTAAQTVVAAEAQAASDAAQLTIVIPE